MTIRTGHIAIAHLFAALLEGEQTVSDLSERTGLCTNSLRHMVKTFRRQQLIYVASWQCDQRGRLTVRSYSLGREKDAVRKIVSIDRAKKERDRRARKKQLETLNALRLVA